MSWYIFFATVRDWIKGGWGLNLLFESKAEEGGLITSLTLSAILDFPIFGRILLQLGAQIGGMHVIYISMGAQSIREGRSILSCLGVFIVLAVTHPTRELLVGLNEAGYGGQQFCVGGGEGGIGPHQLFQRSISVVAAAARASKYLSRSVAHLVGPFACSSWIW